MLAIGGITVDNLDDVLATGCAGIAVISAILADPDPRDAAARLRAALDASPHQPRISTGGTRMQLIVNQQSCEFAGDALDVPTLLASRGVNQDAVAARGQRRGRPAPQLAGA